MKILFVCLGNICRSPLAEGIFKKMLCEKSLDLEIFCDSAGTGAYHIGHLPDPRSVNIAAEMGIELTHLARQVEKNDLETFDLILAMDKSNLSNVYVLNHKNLNLKNKVLLMRDFDPLGKGEVPDPYYGGAGGFKEVYEILHRSCDGLLEYIINKRNG